MEYDSVMRHQELMRRLDLLESVIESTDLSKLSQVTRKELQVTRKEPRKLILEFA